MEDPAAAFVSASVSGCVAAFVSASGSGVHLDLPHAKGGHDHPASTELQSALHPSPLSVLPSSHFSRPASWESPQVVLQTLGRASEHVYPHSTEHTALQPSLAAVLPSSHASEVVLIPSPQTGVQLGPEKP